MNLGNTCKVAWLLPTVIVQSIECGAKKYPLHFARLVLLFVSAVVLFAQTDHVTAFTGTWKLNGAKSTFNPGPAPKSVTVTNAPDGTFQVESVDGQGKTMKWSHAWSGGAEVPIDGIENATSPLEGARPFNGRNDKDRGKDRGNRPRRRLPERKNHDNDCRCNNRSSAWAYA